MKPIRSVHLIGLGAIGGMYAALLHDRNPSLLTVIADRERRERHTRDGVAINDKRYEFRYRDPGASGGAADLLIVGVKQHHLSRAIEDMAGSVGEDTTILSLLNGLTSEELIGKRFGIDRMLYSFCVETDATRERDSVSFTKVGTIVFGERANEYLSERVESVSALFEQCGIPYRVPPDMMRELWWKFMMNVGINPVSAILGAPYGVFQRVAEARELFSSAAREVVVLARASGVDLGESDIEQCLDIFGRLSPGRKTSMLQDVEAGRKTEIEIFAGTVVELGRAHNVPTPINETLLRMVRTLEHGYDGSGTGTGAP